jgi:hypothetical protein
MLIKLLSTPDKKHLVDLAKLLALSDKPLLWDGKTSAELTSDTDLKELTIEEGEHERELIADLEQAAGISSSVSPVLRMFLATSEIGTRLVEVTKTFPITQAERPEFRAQAAKTVLKELLKDKKAEQPSVPKVMLFELLLVALRDGNISSIEWALLKEFQQHHKLEDFIFDDLLERAEVLNKEVNKTLSIVLE